MGSTKSGRVESHVKADAAVTQRFESQRLNMERRYNPDWVFRLTPSPQLRTPSNEYTLHLRGRVAAEDLLRILRAVEGELAAAFIR